METNIALAFERVAARFPERIAVRQPEGPVSYGELLQRVRCTAVTLNASLGADPRPVAVLAAHGAPSITAFLATLRADRVAVLLSPIESPELLRSRLEHVGASALVTDPATSAVAREIAGNSCQIILIDEDQSPREDQSTLSTPVSESQDPSLIIYTSGSTGRPRGVVHSHNSILCNIAYHISALRISGTDLAVLAALPGTISWLTDSLRILLSGGELLPIDLRVTPLAHLPDLFAANPPTILHLVPTIFRRFAQQTTPHAGFERMRVLQIAGEPVTRLDFELFRDCMSDRCSFLHIFGCSEVPTIRRSTLSRSTSWSGYRMPLSEEVAGKEVILLDDEGNTLAAGAGVTGEIAVRTPNAALGYWGDKAATQEIFEPLPDGRVLYRSGDVGRWEADGSLVHLGRIDRSLKLLGSWVDLGSIEMALLQVPGMREAVVVSIPCQQKIRLCAFCSADESLDAAEIRRQLVPRLERASIPERIEVLDSLPILPNGKIDRSLLLDQAAASRPSPSAGRASAKVAKNFTQRTLISLWSKALPGTTPQLESSFVADGGDSLAAVELVSQIEAELAVSIPSALVFDCESLAELAEAIDTLGRTESSGEYLYWTSRPKAEGVETAESDGGPTVLCVGDRRPMRSLIDRFGTSISVAHLRLDGIQTVDFKRLSIDQQVQAYLAELESAGIDQPRVIVGYSYGGLVAYALAAALAQCGATATSLVLLEPSIPGHGNVEWGLAALRVRRRVWQARLRTWRGVGPWNWDRFRPHLWKSARKFKGASPVASIDLVGREDYVDRWSGVWRQRAAGAMRVHRLPITSTHLDVVVDPDLAESWLEAIGDWLHEDRSR